MTYLEQALKDFNLSLPAWKPYYRLEQLSAADLSRVELRAEQLKEEHDRKSPVVFKPGNYLGVDFGFERPAVVRVPAASCDLDDSAYYRPRSMQVRRRNPRDIPI